MSQALPDPTRNRRIAGGVFYALGFFPGLALTLSLLFSGEMSAGGVMTGTCLAFPLMLVYLTVPRLLDRYDPEPWYALLGALFWGGFAATGYSGLVNSAVAQSFGDDISAVVSAPIIEEFTKGLALWGIFFFLRKEFDGVVDGIIYGAFAGLGFAAVENILYFGRSADAGVLGGTIFARAIMSPWAHPVYTSMTGIGLGIARETDKRWVRFVAPLLGYLGAATLHAIWNGSATLAGVIGDRGAMIFLCSLPIWLLFVGTFMALIVVLVRRRGRIIRENLQDEVALGNLTPAELDLVASPWGVMRARRYGSLGVEFVRAAARLALSKWHAARAARSSTSTISWELIVPLRNKLQELRAQYHAELARRQGRPPGPPPGGGYPPQGHPQQGHPQQGYPPPRGPGGPGPGGYGGPGGHGR